MCHKLHITLMGEVPDEKGFLPLELTIEVPIDAMLKWALQIDQKVD